METKFGMHPLLAASVNIMYFCQYLEEQGPVPDALLPDMKHLIEDPSEDILQEFYVNLVHEFVLFNRACRTNNLELFICRGFEVCGIITNHVSWDKLLIIVKSS